MQMNQEMNRDQRVLVCLSSSPSNSLSIRAAARIAQAFHAKFNALYIQTTLEDTLSQADQDRLEQNMNLAKQLGANVEIMYGQDIPYEISEYCKLTGVTQVVLGRSNTYSRSFLSGPSFIEKLSSSLPGIDIYVIPDPKGEPKRQNPFLNFTSKFSFRFKDLAILLATLTIATLVGMFFEYVHLSNESVISIYILGILVISVMTSHLLYGMSASLLTVFVFNYFFTDPRFTLRVYNKDYWITFVVMFIISVITSNIAHQLKIHTHSANQAAQRLKILFDESQNIQKAESIDEILSSTANHLSTFLKTDIVVYENNQNELSNFRFYPYDADSLPDQNEEDKAAALWTLQNAAKSGNNTRQYPKANYTYYTVHDNESIFGVFGIRQKERYMDVYETGIIVSILNICAIAIKNEINAQARKEAMIEAENEHFRANILRTISHDLRTPLTSISGNASNLLQREDLIDAKTRHQLYSDIYDDSVWLIQLVENLLSISRIESDQMGIRLSQELINDVIEEALRHIDPKDHQIIVEEQNKMFLVEMDTNLIVQVIINLVNNAIKYTPKGSHIWISTDCQDDHVYVSIKDDGPGIPDTEKSKIFDMFYSVNNPKGDNIRSTGLGLALCKSILNAHGGSITVSDNHPHGAVFTFVLKGKEVEAYE